MFLYYNIKAVNIPNRFGGLSMGTLGVGFMTFIWVLIVIIGIILAGLIIFAPIKLWSIDNTLKAILEELKKQK